MTEAETPFHILLAEDNCVDVLVTREAVEGWNTGNVLHVVTDGKQALDFLLQRGEHVGSPRVNLILLDLNLPMKNAKEILREIKKQPDLECIPVVIITTSESTRDREECSALGADVFISKPIGLEEYILAIESVRMLAAPCVE